MSNLIGAPPDVVQVHEAMVKNANNNWQDTEFAEGAVYTRLAREGSDQDKWIVSPNFEGYGGAMLRHPDGSWWYREWMSEGPDKPMEHGVDEALANASIWFTG